MVTHVCGLNCIPSKFTGVPWTTRRSNQSILKVINPEYTLEGLMLKLKLQYFDHLMQRANSLEKTLLLGKIEGRRTRGWQRMRWLDGITTQWTWVCTSSGRWRWTGKPGVLQSMGSKDSDTTEGLNNKIRMWETPSLAPQSMTAFGGNWG